MPRNKDIWLILAALIAALIVFLLSKWMPRATVKGRTADVTMAPDAVEYLEPTEKPVTAAPAATQAPEATVVPATEKPVSAAPQTPEVTESPTSETAVPAEAQASDMTVVPETVKPETPEKPEVTEVPATVETVAVETPEVLETPAPDEMQASELTVAPAGEETATAATAAPEMMPAPEKEKATVMGPMIGPMPELPAEPVKGYVVIMVSGRQYGDPIPMDRDKIITIRQDEHTINRVHITRESVYMESSTCENQDCVGEGTVTFDNYRTRILGEYIICLPNGVSVQMIPAEESEAAR